MSSDFDHSDSLAWVYFLHGRRRPSGIDREGLLSDPQLLVDQVCFSARIIPEDLFDNFQGIGMMSQIRHGPS